LHFRHAAELNSKDPWVHYYSALLMNEMALSREEHRQVSAQMKKELKAAITEDPDFADAYNLLADACFYAGEYDAAIDNMKKATALSPRNEPYALSLAHYYAAARKWDEAVAVLAKLKNSPNSRVSVNAVQQLNAVERSRREAQSENLESFESKLGGAGTGAIKYLKGTLVHVDCSTTPAAVLSVESDGKVWRLATPDAGKLLLIGADAFSCAWSNQQVLINYRQTGEAEGFAVSLEIQ
jgi:tetratricopeptide (TPR) repeat protein